MTACRPPRRVTLCVDDFGLHPGINAAVLALAQRQRIGAVSCMVGAPAWQHGAAALRDLDRARIDVGLHLDLTEYPLAAAARQALFAWLARAWLRQLDRQLLRTEICRQLDRFEAAVGRPPAHVDGHQHVHQLPVVREVLLDLLADRYPGRLPWLRSTRMPAHAPRPRLKARLIQALGQEGLRRHCLARGFRQNEHLLGVYGFAGGADRYLALLEAWLGVAVDGDVLMCHPSADADAGSLPGARRAEFDVLCSPRFGALLLVHGIQGGPLRIKEGELNDEVPDEELDDRGRPGLVRAVRAVAGAVPGHGDARPCE